MASISKSPRADRSVSPRALQPILARLRKANRADSRLYPGESHARQPVHTLYGGAHLFRSDTIGKLGAAARLALDDYAPDAGSLVSTFGFEPELAAVVRARVEDKLAVEPIEDFRIDFEDGYGIRTDAEEDGHARTVAQEVAAADAAGLLPPFVGIRIKALSAEMHARSLRTLDLFVTALSRAGRGLPENFVVTIPKVMTPAHVTAVATMCAALEHRLKLRRNSVALELMIETPQSILGPDGSSPLRALVAAGNGRVRGAHFGTYDYTALCGITSSWQHMRHAACDFARHMMQVALAQSGVWLSDGATNILPIPPHRPARGGALSEVERRENHDAVHRAWRVHFDDAQHSLVNGFYQGWDLHPAQLPSRFAAVYSFFLAARPAATVRLRNFIEKAAQATLVGDVFDDAATGQGLLNFFLRGLNCGALSLEEAEETGLTRDELQGRSFMKIVEARRK
jgi:citrate lyase beta subunit